MSGASGSGNHASAVGKRPVSKKLVVWGGGVAALVVASFGLLSMLSNQGCGVTMSAEVASLRSDILQVCLGLRTFAHDHDGRFPHTIDELYPKYIDVRNLFETDFTLSGATEFHWYRPGLRDDDGSREPIILAPPPPKGKKRVIGFVGGNVSVLHEHDERFPEIHAHEWIR